MKIKRGADEDGTKEAAIALNSDIVQQLSETPPVDLPYAFARKFGFILDSSDGERISIAMRDGADPQMLIEIRRYLAMPFDVAILDSAAFDKQLGDHYAMDGSAAAMADAFNPDSADRDLLAAELPSAEDLLDSVDDAPAIRLINGIIAEAVRQGVSDIHVEPYETGLVVRMRSDGVLEEKLRMPAHVSPVVVSRIKVMARLDIAERRVPQDGRISIMLGGKVIDVRVSTLPSSAGERVVMRILDKDSGFVSLDLLGMSDECHQILHDALSEPNGVILVTGPTGSGKTTTLYAGLKHLNDGTRNILTVEDPVEYAVEGVGQTQVNTKVGMTFAAGLRAILRQDPDVVMVGEIRDKETADIAVQAALTGHLVLSSVHTNDAIGAITRLRDMQIEPFLLASTLRAVLAQRLVRRLCPHCSRVIQAERGIASMLGMDQGSAVRVPGKGCDKCNNTGYLGRIGVFEAIRIDENIRNLINKGDDEAIIARYAFVNQPNLAGAVRRLVQAGEITLEDAIRVSKQERKQDA